MRTESERPAKWAFIPAALLIVCACSSQPTKQAAETNTVAASSELTGHGSTVINIQPGQPGGEAIQTFQKLATVMDIDKQKRQVTLITPDGVKTVVKAGPEVANFDQIQPGDRVKATITEELVVFVRKSGEAAADKQTTTEAAAPAGAKPGLMRAETVEIAGKITAIDLAQHKATLEFSDGQSRTFRVRKDVDLAKRSVGEEVVIRSTEAMVLLVERP